MSDGGYFGNWITDSAGLPAFEVLVSKVRHDRRGETNGKHSARLVLPQGGLKRVWHLLGAGTLIGTPHLCGDITFYYMPRTILKVTGRPGSQRRTFSTTSSTFVLDDPDRVIFGCGWCEWTYRFRCNETFAGAKELSNPQEVLILRRARVDSEGCISIEVKVEGAPEDSWYEETWSIAPEPLLPIPLMGKGPVPTGATDIGQAFTRAFAYAVSSAVRGVGSTLRSFLRFSYRLHAEVVDGKMAVIHSESGRGRERTDLVPESDSFEIPVSKPAVVDLSMPSVVFELDGAVGSTYPEKSRDKANSDSEDRRLPARLQQLVDGPRDRASVTVLAHNETRRHLQASGGQGKAKVKIEFYPDRSSTLLYTISFSDDTSEGRGIPVSPRNSKSSVKTFNKKTRVRSTPAPLETGDAACIERLPKSGDPQLDRELAWHLSCLRQLAVEDSYFGRRFVTQGSAYTFLQGAHGAPRDYAISVGALAETDPPLARSTLEVMLMMSKPSGSMFYMHAGRGWCWDAVVHSDPSDLPIFLLWAICEYINGSKDDSFLDVSLPFYPLHSKAYASVADRIKLAFRWLRDTLGRGPHGLLKVGSGDWADPISMMVEDPKAFHRDGESVLNTAFAAHVLPNAAALLGDRDPIAAAEMVAFAEELVEALKLAWTGRWYLRGWDGKGNPLGDTHLFLDAQCFCLIAGVVSGDFARILLEEIRTRCMEPSPIGAVILDRPHPVKLGLIPEGWDCNGGVWAAINAFLAWGLARYDRKLAIESLRKQTLAQHARVYPSIWYGIWSGPDAYNSYYAQRPGETFNLPATPMSEYPVMNSNAHAGPLLAARKIFDDASHCLGSS